MKQLYYIGLVIINIRQQKFAVAATYISEQNADKVCCHIRILNEFL